MANTHTGWGTVTVGGTAILTQGPPVSGIEADIAFLTPDSLTSVSDVVLVNVTPYVKFTSIECEPATMDDIWGMPDAAGDVAEFDIGSPASKSVKAGVVVLHTTDAGLFELAEGIACDFGELQAAPGEYVKADATYKGIASDGGTAPATYTAVS